MENEDVGDFLRKVTCGDAKSFFKEYGITYIFDRHTLEEIIEGLGRPELNLGSGKCYIGVYLEKKLLLYYCPGGVDNEYGNNKKIFVQ